MTGRLAEAVELRAVGVLRHDVAGMFEKASWPCGRDRATA